MVNNYTYLAKNISPPSELEILKGEGIFVYDKNGQKYFDLSSQTANLNLGHRHPIIMQAIEEYLKSEKPYFLSSRWQSSYMADLASKLIEIAPQGMSKANVKLCNGSDALEDAFKRARRFHKNKGKRVIVAQYRSHHGESSETLSASGKNFQYKQELGGSGDFIFIDPVYTYRKPSYLTDEEYSELCSKNLEELVKKRDYIAGIVLEPILVTGGVIPQPKSFMKNVERICRENNITFILDEVQTAFGWLGTMFASDHYDIKPDIIALGKGISAGFPALAATIFKEEYDNLNYGESEFTNGGEPLTCVASLANINYLKNSNILNTIPEKQNHFMERLLEIKDKYKQIGDVRGLGLILGIEFMKNAQDPDPEITEKIYQTALANKLILRKADCDGKIRNVLIIKPPIITTHEEIDESMDLLEKSLEQCLK